MQPSAKPASVKRRKHSQSKSRRDSINDDTEGSGTESALGEKMEIDASPKLNRNALSHKIQPLVEVNAHNFEIKDNCVTINGPNSKFLHPVSDADTITDVKPELLKLLQEKLFDRHCVTLNDMKLFLSDISPECISNGEITDKSLEDHVIAAGAKKLQNKWPPDATPEPLFAITDCGDHLDKCRRLLLDMFSTKSKIRLATLKKKIEEDIDEKLSNTDYEKLMQEYCVSKSGFYYLKGTLQGES